MHNYTKVTHSMHSIQTCYELTRKGSMTVLLSCECCLIKHHSALLVTNYCELCRNDLHAYAEALYQQKGQLLNLL